MVLIVGAVGLSANILGMVLFGGHVHHDHGDGGHDDHEHGGHDHGAHAHGKETHKSHDHSDTSSNNEVEFEDNQDAVPMHYSSKMNLDVIAAAERLRTKSGSSSESAANSHDHNAVGHSHEHGDHSSHHEKHDAHDHHDSHASHAHDHVGHAHGGGGHDGHNHGNMNMQGLFLHAMGDALGSIGVIISSLIIMYADGHWRYYMDPIISLLISGLIISSAVPLVRSASFILLQGVPTHIDLSALKSEILGITGVLGIHEFHVWGLSDSKTVASVHVRVQDNDRYMEIATLIKKMLHGYGIHSTTVQPEFVRNLNTPGEDMSETGCLLKCEGGGCAEQVCCPDDEELVSMRGVSVTPSPRVASPPAEFLVSGEVRVSSASGSEKKNVPFVMGRKDSHGHGGEGHGHSHQGHSEHGSSHQEHSDHESQPSSGHAHSSEGGCGGHSDEKKAEAHGHSHGHGGDKHDTHGHH
ncbi:hypothetical protein HDU98_002457 [Podochytrium sp. JEL0797]|nr:hypothetical protein HDU98_002457 [Podochytrium sp. JEL0797]